MYYAIRIERFKKRNDIYTYKEIVAFQNGEKLDDIEKAREIKKRHYQIIIFGLIAAFVGLAITVIMREIMP